MAPADVQGCRGEDLKQRTDLQRHIRRGDCRRAQYRGRLCSPHGVLQKLPDQLVVREHGGPLARTLRSTAEHLSLIAFVLMSQLSLSCSSSRQQTAARGSMHATSGRCCLALIALARSQPKGLLLCGADLAVVLHRLCAVGEPVEGGEVDGLRAVPAVAEAAVEGTREGDHELARLLHSVDHVHACKTDANMSLRPKLSPYTTCDQSSTDVAVLAHCASSHTASELTLQRQ